MKKDTKQILFLVGLSLAWLVSWRLNRQPEAPPPPATKKTARESALESPLTMRFRRIRAETDALYHYRLKPIPFSFDNNPFRLPPSMESEDDQPKPPPAASAPKSGVVVVTPAAQSDTGETLLRKTIQSARIGGVVTMNGISQLNVNGELHKEGEVFSARLGTRLILIKIKKLTTTYAIMALDDPESGGAEMRIKLN
jgi:hypothetical protein